MKLTVKLTARASPYPTMFGCSIKAGMMRSYTFLPLAGGRGTAPEQKMLLFVNFPRAIIFVLKQSLGGVVEGPYQVVCCDSFKGPPTIASDGPPSS